MAVQGNLTLNTKVYTPRGKQGDVASWALVGDATFGGATSTVTESVRLPTKTVSENRIQFRLEAPKAAAADSACACTGEVLGTGLCVIDVKVPPNFTPAERGDFCLRIQALVATAVFSSAVSNLEPSW